MSPSILSLSFQDVLPSAWSRASAKKLDLRDAFLPFLILPLIIIVSAISFEVTVVVMVFTAMAVLYVYSRPLAKNRSPFFFSWTLASGVYMFYVFEVSVLTHFMVTRWEHISFLLMLASTLYCFYKMKKAADFELAMGSSKDKTYSPVLTADSYYCQICQIEVNERLFHSIWWNCCILRANYLYYLAGQITAFATLLMGVHLGISTVCYPTQYHIYGSIIVYLPEDCTDVYYYYYSYYAIIFVTCVYALGYQCVIVLVLLRALLKLRHHLKIWKS